MALVCETGAISASWRLERDSHEPRQQLRNSGVAQGHERDHVQEDAAPERYAKASLSGLVAQRLLGDDRARPSTDDTQRDERALSNTPAPLPGGRLVERVGDER